MALDPGTRLGPYEVVAKLGEGGMGDVYRAQDARLGRDVAIKTSKIAFDDRFQREARSIAALNHPNVCTLYDVGPDYLVMEYIDGETLADRLREGALTESDALTFATQMAAALEAAHDKGIIHRDLKPANIKITSTGQVKVLDFGLAKALGPDSSTSSAAVTENSPTFATPAMTGGGFILGTAGYMAPEQARGQGVDRRADIWAFGIVLWEMLTGRRLFQGDTSSDLLAAVLKEEPRWDDVPVRLRPLLRRCLEKDPRKRLHDIADARLWLDDVPVAAGEQRRPAIGRYAPWVLAALLAVVAAATWIWRGRQPVSPTDSLHFTLSAPPGVGLGDFTPGASFSHDGRFLAFAGVDSSQSYRLYVHALATGETRVLPGTEGANDPLWSPDGRSLAFRVSTKLKRLNLSGGSPEDLGDIPPDAGSGFWDQGFIVLGSGTGLWRLPESGGQREQLTSIDPSRGELFHGSPQALDDHSQFIYFIQSSDASARGLYLGSVGAPRERRLLVRTANKGVFASSGLGGPSAILYLQEDTLMAQGFDVKRGQLAGQAAIVAGPIRRQGGMGPGTASYWAAPTGILAYRLPDATDNTPLIWRSRDGTRLGDLAPPQGRFSSFFLSPDGSKVTVDVRSAQGPHDVWIHDFARGTWEKQTSDPGNDFLGVWSPEGNRIVFGSSRTGVAQLFLTAPGSTREERITDGPWRKYPLQWTRDLLLYRGTDEAHPVGSLWGLRVDGDRKPFPVVQDQYAQFTGQISPDGKWIAYQSTKSTINEIYLQSFPAGGATITVSNRGGRWPKWRADGLELYYISGNDAIISVPLTRSGESLIPGAPKELFRTSIQSDLTYSYDVTRDAKRFLVLERQDSAGRFEVVTNWRAAIKH